MLAESVSRRKFIARAGAAGAGLAGVSLAGCTTTTTQITANPTTAATTVTTMAPVYGGTLTMMLTEWPDDVDWRTGGVNANAKADWAHVGDALINFEPDFTTKGIIIESWSTNSDYTVWTLKFREGVKFHNGNEVTTHDFEGFLKAYTGATDYKGPKPFFQGVFKPKIKSWDVVDSYTINVNMASPQFEFDRDLANYPIYMTTYDQWMSPSQLTTLIGTGAWKFTEHVTRQYILLYKNPDWWAAKAGLTMLDSFWYGTQYLDRILIKYGPEDATKLVALETGDADIAQLMDVATAEQAVANPNLDVLYGPETRAVGTLFNIRNAPLDDVRTREMLLKAIDWQSLFLIAAKGLNPCYSLFQNSPYENHEAANRIAQYNPARAQSLYNTLKAEGKLNRKLIIYNNIGLPGEKAGEFIVSSIKNVLPNLDIMTKNLDTSTMQVFRSKNIIYDPASPENHWDIMSNTGTPGGIESALTPAKQMLSKTSTYVSGPNATVGCMQTNCTGNFMGWTDPQVEQLITDAANDPVLANRVSKLGQAENIALDAYLFRLYCFGGVWYGYRKKVHGFRTSPVFKKAGFTLVDVWKES